MFSAKGHSCGDCKLTCIDCDGQICPKCMVVCPVGNRCQRCSGRFVSHVLKISGWAMVRTLGAAMLVGYGFGAASSFSPIGGFYLLFIVYLAGLVAGNVLHKISGHKLGARVVSCVVGGIVAGFLASPAYGKLFPPTAVVSGYNYALVSAKRPSNAELTLLARQNWPEFIGAFQNRAKEDLFTVKAPISRQDKASDHLWLVVQDINADQLTCEVPHSLVHRYGPQLKVNVSDIDDWQYQNAEGTSGGLTKGVVGQAMRQSQSPWTWYALCSGILSLAVFCFGAVTPFFGGSGPDIRNPFRLR